METRERIIQGAAELFIKNGVKAVTMDDVAISLGMSKRTIYENIADKNSLIKEALIYHSYNKDKDMIESMAGKPVVEIIRILLATLRQRAQQMDFRLYNEVKRFYPALYSEVVEVRKCEGLARMIELIEQGKREGIFLPEVDSEQASHILHLQLDQFSNPEAYDPLTQAMNIFKTVIIIFFRGIASEGGVRQIDQMIEEVEGLRG